MTLQTHNQTQMNRSVAARLSLLLITVLAISACNPSGNTGKETADTTASVGVGTFDVTKIKDQIVSIMQAAPNADHIAVFLNQTGTSYIFDLCLPVEEAGRFMTTEKQSLAMGVYSFDLAYARAFNRVDNFAKILEAEQALATKLGAIEEVKSKQNIAARLKANLKNKDSLNLITEEGINELSQRISESNRPDIYALSFIGSSVEGLYITTELAQMAKNPQPLIVFLSNQKERAQSVYDLLELMSGLESVAPIFEKMKPVMAFFTEGKVLTTNELKQLDALLEPVRQEIIK